MISKNLHFLDMLTVASSCLLPQVFLDTVHSMLLEQEIMHHTMVMRTVTTIGVVMGERGVTPLKKVPLPKIIVFCHLFRLVDISKTFVKYLDLSANEERHTRSVGKWDPSSLPYSRAIASHGPVCNCRLEEECFKQGKETKGILKIFEKLSIIKQFNW